MAAVDNESVEQRLILTQVKSKLAQLEAKLDQALAYQREDNQEIKERLSRLEHCPCRVHRDPGHECPLLEMNGRLAKLEKMLARYGGVAVGVWALLQVVFHYLQK
jgi:hypothetical protein